MTNPSATTLFKSYEKKVPITRKVGESRESCDEKFSTKSLKISGRDSQNSDVNYSVSLRSYAGAKRENYKTPNKRGVMSERDKVKKEKPAKAFVARTTNNTEFNVGFEATIASYTKPFRKPHSEAAIKEAPKVLGRNVLPSTFNLDFGKYGTNPMDRKQPTTTDLNYGSTRSGPYICGYLGHKPRSEHNRALVKTLKKYGEGSHAKVDVLANMHQNMPGYTGFQPKNRGPFQASGETTSSRASQLF